MPSAPEAQRWLAPRFSVGNRNSTRCQSRRDSATIFLLPEQMLESVAIFDANSLAHVGRSWVKFQVSLPQSKRARAFTAGKPAAMKLQKYKFRLTNRGAMRP
jgi:hypothetical protein